MSSWLLPSHVGILAIYGIVGYALTMFNGPTTTAVVNYLLGIILLLSVIAWHWWKGFYS